MLTAPTFRTTLIILQALIIPNPATIGFLDFFAQFSRQIEQRFYHEGA